MEKEERNSSDNILLRIREKINGETIIGAQLAFGSFGTIFSVPLGGWTALPLALAGSLGLSLIVDDILLASRVFKYVFSFFGNDHNNTADEK